MFVTGNQKELEFKEYKLTDFVCGWQSKSLFKSKLFSLNDAFLPNTKYFGKKIGIQFSDTALVIEQNDWTTKAVNACIVNDLDNWPKTALRNFALKIAFFDAMNIAKNSDKSKWMYSGYGIAFDGKSEWNFVNNSGRML